MRDTYSFITSHFLHYQPINIVLLSFRYRSAYRSIGATIGANLRFIGAIGAIIGANIEFIGDIIGDMSTIIDDNTKFISDIFYDILYDKNRFTMTLLELSMTSNIDYIETNNQSNFFNSSISGRASFNISGISLEVVYVATPIGLS